MSFYEPLNRPEVALPLLILGIITLWLTLDRQALQSTIKNLESQISIHQATIKTQALKQQEAERTIQLKANEVQDLQQQYEQRVNQNQNLKNQLSATLKNLLNHPQYITLQTERDKLLSRVNKTEAVAAELKEDIELLASELSKARNTKSFNTFAKCPFCDYKVPLSIQRNSIISIFSFLKEHIVENHFKNIEDMTGIDHDIAHFLCMCENPHPQRYEGMDIDTYRRHEFRETFCFKCRLSYQSIINRSKELDAEEQRLLEFRNELLEERQRLRAKASGPSSSKYNNHYTSSQQRAIKYMRYNEVHTPAELAKGLKMDSSNAWKVLDSLIKLGAIEKVNNRWMVVS